MPSGQPSMNPSVSDWPSSKPSESPSISTQPSSMPSYQPSGLLSEAPSVSDRPTSIPSENPSVSGSPSSQPSESPSISTEPSSIPSSQPSGMPSEVPSLSGQTTSIPSVNPSVSGGPSSMPSENPSVSGSQSSQPSKSPSISTQPSWIPSPEPSAMPSDLPSQTDLPSLMPSESPSGSLAPTSQPSIMSSVSNWPTTLPSSEPSTGPSVLLSGMPSDQPTSSLNKQTSSTPSELPSGHPTPLIHDFYPDFDSDVPACRNDGNELPYMRKDPESYLFASVKECCESYFQWDIGNCRRNSLGDFLWYPIFDAESGGCRNDGNEPMHFRGREGYLFSSLKECCEVYFPWDIPGCIEPSDPDPCPSFMDIYDVNYLIDSERGYYPIFDPNDDDLYCVNDGNAPGYMLAFPQAWVHSTLEACCRANFQHLLEDCMGPNGENIALNPCVIETAKHTNKWYVIYHLGGNDPECVQDCGVGPDCYSWSDYHDELYESYSACCVAHIFGGCLIVHVL